jgi:hypothetical protein
MEASGSGASGLRSARDSRDAGASIRAGGGGSIGSEARGAPPRAAKNGGASMARLLTGVQRILRACL